MYAPMFLTLWCLVYIAVAILAFHRGLGSDDRRLMFMSILCVKGYALGIAAIWWIYFLLEAKAGG